MSAYRDGTLSKARRPGTRPVGVFLLLAVLLGSGAPALPEEADASEAILVAHYVETVGSAGEEKAWDWLQGTRLDPWILAERLLQAGKPELARRLPASGLTEDHASLASYLEDAAPAPAALVAAVDRAAELHGEGKAEAALAALGEQKPASLRVTDIRALALMGEILSGIGREDEAVGSLERAADRASAIGWRRAEIAARTVVLSKIPADKQKPQQRRILSALVALDADARDLARSASWCGRLGRLEAELGSQRLARGWLLEADGLFEALAGGARITRAQAVERARVTLALASTHLALGDKAHAMATAVRGHEMSRSADIPASVRIMASKRLADANWALSRLEEAERHLREAVQTAEAQALPEHTALLGDLALLRSKRGAYEEAEALYERVRTSAWVKKNPWAAYIVRLHIAALHLERPPEHLVKAKIQEALLDLLVLLRDLDAESAALKRRAETEANTLALAGRAHLLLHRYSEAETYLRRAAESPYTKDVALLLPYVNTQLAQALRRQDKTEEALAVLRTSLGDLEREIRALPGSFALNLLAQSQSRAVVAECRAAALAAGTPEVLHWALEGTRGAAFRVEVGRRRLRRAGTHGFGLLPEAVTLRAAVASAARAYWKSRSRGVRIEVVGARRDLWERRKSLRAAEERSGLEAAIASQDATKSSGTSPEFKNRTALREDEALLFLVAPEAQQMLVLRRRDRYRVFDLGAKSEIETAIAEAAEAWAHPGEADPDKAAERVTKLVFPAAVRGALAEGRPLRHIYISAAGPLARMPWPFLIDAALGDVKVDGKQVPAPTTSMVASESVLRHLRTWNAPARGGPVLALGDPDYTTSEKHPLRMVFFGHKLPRLEHSGKEVQTIVDKDRDDIALVGTYANETLLRRYLFEAPYPFDTLHFACHGLLYRKVPWLSALAIHAAEGEDGLVTVDEIARWQFQGGPRLVVLSACKTGLGVPVPGEGEEGLVRAFLLAGARHVVASLWNVPDRSSSHLMIAFHEKLRAGQTPTQALRAAQQETRVAYPHPHAWAGWNVWGPGD